MKQKQNQKQSAHTPGPWSVSMPGGQTTFNGRRVTVTARGSMVADLDWNSPMENMANARLIAAAPELLEALHRVCRDLEYAYGGQGQMPEMEAGFYSQARSALARARVEDTPAR